MAAVAQFASDLWNTAATGVSTVGAAASAAGAAAILHAGKFRGIRPPTSALGVLMFGSLAAVTILVMILSNPPNGTGGQKYYTTGRLNVHFNVENEIVLFPLPDAIAQDGAFGDRTVPGMTKKTAIVLSQPIVKQDVTNLATAMKLIHKNKSHAVKLGEWVSVLKLTGIDMPFDFEKLSEGLRENAIAGVDAFAEQGLVSPAMLLSLGLDNSIARWIACPAEKLARRDETISEEESEAIGHRYASALNDIRQDSFMWLLRQKVAPVNGRQDYPHFWYSVVKDAFVDELAEDRDWLPLLESPCI